MKMGGQGLEGRNVILLSYSFLQVPFIKSIENMGGEGGGGAMGHFIDATFPVSGLSLLSHHFIIYIVLS